MMKKIKVFSLLSLMFLLSGNIFADSLFLGGKQSRGVSNMYYYVDSSASGYTTLINDAIDNWVVTGWGWNPIYLAPVASNNGTALDFYLKYSDQLSYSILGQTTFYNSSEVQLNPATTDWFFAKIDLNGSSLPNISYNNRQGTISHEIGHGLGLAHQNSNTSSIMCSLASGRTVYTVDQTSHNAINTLY